MNQFVFMDDENEGNRVGGVGFQFFVCSPL